MLSRVVVWQDMTLLHAVVSADCSAFFVASFGVIYSYTLPAADRTREARNSAPTLPTRRWMAAPIEWRGRVPWAVTIDEMAGHLFIAFSADSAGQYAVARVETATGFTSSASDWLATLSQWPLSLAVDLDTHSLWVGVAGPDRGAASALRLRTSDLEVTASVALGRADDGIVYPLVALVDPTTHHVYFGTYSDPAAIVRVTAQPDGTAAVTGQLQFGPGEAFMWRGALSSERGVAFFGGYDLKRAAGVVVMLNLADFERAAVLRQYPTVRTPEESGGLSAVAVDAEAGLLFTVTDGAWGVVSKLALPSFALVQQYQFAGGSGGGGGGPDGGFASLLVDSPGGYIFLPSGLSRRIHRMDSASLSRAGTVRADIPLGAAFGHAVAVPSKGVSFIAVRPALAPSGGAIRTQCSIVVLNMRTFTVAAVVPLPVASPAAPSHPVADPASNTAYVIFAVSDGSRVDGSVVATAPLLVKLSSQNSSVIGSFDYAVDVATSLGRTVRCTIMHPATGVVIVAVAPFATSSGVSSSTPDLLLRVDAATLTLLSTIDVASATSTASGGPAASALVVSNALPVTIGDAAVLFSAQQRVAWMANASDALLAEVGRLSAAGQSSLSRFMASAGRGVVMAAGASVSSVPSLTGGAAARLALLPGSSGGRTASPQLALFDVDDPTGAQATEAGVGSASTQTTAGRRSSAVSLRLRTIVASPETAGEANVLKEVPDRAPGTGAAAVMHPSAGLLYVFPLSRTPTVVKLRLSDLGRQSIYVAPRDSSYDNGTGTAGSASGSSGSGIASANGVAIEALRSPVLVERYNAIFLGGAEPVSLRGLAGEGKLPGTGAALLARLSLATFTIDATVSAGLPPPLSPFDAAIQLVAGADDPYRDVLYFVSNAWKSQLLRYRLQTVSAGGAGNASSLNCSSAASLASSFRGICCSSGLAVGRPCAIPVAHGSIALPVGVGAEPRLTLDPDAAYLYIYSQSAASLNEPALVRVRLVPAGTPFVAAPVETLSFPSAGTASVAAVLFVLPIPAPFGGCDCAARAAAVPGSPCYFGRPGGTGHGYVAYVPLFRSTGSEMTTMLVNTTDLSIVYTYVDTNGVQPVGGRIVGATQAWPDDVPSLERAPLPPDVSYAAGPSFITLVVSYPSPYVQERTDSTVLFPRTLVVLKEGVGGGGSNSSMSTMAQVLGRPGRILPRASAWPLPVLANDSVSMVPSAAVAPGPFSCIRGENIPAAVALLLGQPARLLSISWGDPSQIRVRSLVHTVGDGWLQAAVVYPKRPLTAAGQLREPPAPSPLDNTFFTFDSTYTHTLGDAEAGSYVLYASHSSPGMLRLLSLPFSRALLQVAISKWVGPPVRLPPGDERFVVAVLHRNASTAIFVTEGAGSPVRALPVRLNSSDVKPMSSTPLSPDVKAASCAALDEAGGRLFIGLASLPGRVITVNVTFAAGASDVTMAQWDDAGLSLPGEPIAAAIHARVQPQGAPSRSIAAYFALQAAPGAAGIQPSVSTTSAGTPMLAQVALADPLPRLVRLIPLPAGLDFPRALVVDALTWHRPLQADGTSTGEFVARNLSDTTGGTSNCRVSIPQVAALASEDAVPFLFVGSGSAPAMIASYRLHPMDGDSQPVLHNVITLEAGESGVLALAVDPCRGFVYASLDTFPAVLIQLDGPQLTRVDRKVSDTVMRTVALPASFIYDVHTAAIVVASSSVPSSLDVYAGSPVRPRISSLVPNYAKSPRFMPASWACVLVPEDAASACDFAVAGGSTMALADISGSFLDARRFNASIQATGLFRYLPEVKEWELAALPEPDPPYPITLECSNQRPGVAVDCVFELPQQIAEAKGWFGYGNTSSPTPPLTAKSSSFRASAVAVIVDVVVAEGPLSSSPKQAAMFEPFVIGDVSPTVIAGIGPADRALQVFTLMPTSLNVARGDSLWLAGNDELGTRLPCNLSVPGISSAVAQDLVCVPPPLRAEYLGIRFDIELHINGRRVAIFPAAVEYAWPVFETVLPTAPDMLAIGGGTVVRAAGRALAPALDDPQVVMAATAGAAEQAGKFGFPVPYLRAWVGSSPCLNVSYTTTTLREVSCNAPAGAGRQVPLTVEVGGLYKVTSFEAAPLGQRISSYLATSTTDAFAIAPTPPQVGSHTTLQYPDILIEAVSPAQLGLGPVLTVGATLRLAGPAGSQLPPPEAVSASFGGIPCVDVSSDGPTAYTCALRPQDAATALGINAGGSASATGSFSAALNLVLRMPGWPDVTVVRMATSVQLVLLGLPRLQRADSAVPLPGSTATAAASASSNTSVFALLTGDALGRLPSELPASSNISAATAAGAGAAASDDGSPILLNITFGGIPVRLESIVRVTGSAAGVTTSLHVEAPPFDIDAMGGSNVVKVVVVTTAGASDAVTFAYPAKLIVQWATAASGAGANATSGATVSGQRYAGLGVSGLILGSAPPTLRIRLGSASRCTLALVNSPANVSVALTGGIDAVIVYGSPSVVFAEAEITLGELLPDPVAVTLTARCRDTTTGDIVSPHDYRTWLIASPGAAWARETLDALQARRAFVPSDADTPLIAARLTVDEAAAQYLEARPTDAAGGESSDMPTLPSSSALSIFKNFRCNASILAAAAAAPPTQPTNSSSSCSEVVYSSGDLLALELPVIEASADVTGKMTGRVLAVSAVGARASLSLRYVPLGAALVLRAECAWAPSTARITLPPLPLRAVAAAPRWRVAPPGAADSQTSLQPPPVVALSVATSDALPPAERFSCVLNAVLVGSGAGGGSAPGPSNGSAAGSASSSSSSGSASGSDFVVVAQAISGRWNESLTFDSFSIAAPRGYLFAARAACALGAQALPPLEFNITMRGCPRGKQPGSSTASASLLCNDCPSGSWSDGGEQQCVPCPATGASCANGVLRLLPGFYRPVAQRSQPWVVGNASQSSLQQLQSQQSQLLPCPAPEACTVDPEARTHACNSAAGYVESPLCAACEPGFSRRGSSCVACPSAATSVTVLVVLALLFAGAVWWLGARWLPTHRSRGRATVALLQLTTLLQTAGVLVSLQAPQLAPLRAVAGWAAVLAEGLVFFQPIDCLWPDWPYTLRVAGAVLLPLALAAAAALLAAVRQQRACGSGARAGRCPLPCFSDKTRNMVAAPAGSSASRDDGDADGGARGFSSSSAAGLAERNARSADAIAAQQVNPLAARTGGLASDAALAAPSSPAAVLKGLQPPAGSITVVDALSLRHRAAASLLLCCACLRLPILITCFSALHCYETAIDDVRYLSVDMRVACGSPAQRASAAIAVAAILCLIAALPLYTVARLGQPREWLRQTAAAARALCSVLLRLCSCLRCSRSRSASADAAVTTETGPQKTSGAARPDSQRPSAPAGASSAVALSARMRPVPVWMHALYAGYDSSRGLLWFDAVQQLQQAALAAVAVFLRTSEAAPAAAAAVLLCHFVSLEACRPFQQHDDEHRQHDKQDAARPDSERLLGARATGAAAMLLPVPNGHWGARIVLLCCTAASVLAMMLAVSSNGAVDVGGNGVAALPADATSAVAGIALAYLLFALAALLLLWASAYGCRLAASSTTCCLCRRNGDAPKRAAEPGASVDAAYRTRRPTGRGPLRAPEAPFDVGSTSAQRHFEGGFLPPGALSDAMVAQASPLPQRRGTFAPTASHAVAAAVTSATLPRGARRSTAAGGAGAYATTGRVSLSPAPASAYGVPAAASSERKQAALQAQLRVGDPGVSESMAPSPLNSHMRPVRGSVASNAASPPSARSSVSAAVAQFAFARGELPPTSHTPHSRRQSRLSVNATPVPVTVPVPVARKEGGRAPPLAPASETTNL